MFFIFWEGGGMKAWFMLVFLLFGFNSNAQQVAAWEVLDINIINSLTNTNPFTIDVNAVFTHQTGQKQIVPLVYNGEGSNNKQQWLLRFSSGLVGQWRYEIKDNRYPQFNDVKGKLSVTNNPDQTNHGAMTIAKDNKQSFEYEDGSPYFLLGYELVWLFAFDYHNKNGLPKSEHLLSLIKESGFNHIVMNVFAFDVNWKKDPKLANHPEHEFGGDLSIYPFLGDNNNPDFSKLNIEFFKKFDRTVQLLHDKRIVAHLMIYVWNKLVNWPDMNTDADNMYFDYVVKRYSAYPNVVWDISKEALYYGRADEAYIKNRIERLRNINYFDRLVTVHDYKYCSKYPEQVDFISTQDWGSELYSRMLDVRKKFPNKPIYNIEHGGYERSPYVVFPGDYTDPEVALRRNWMSVFAGVYSTYYWQANAWNVIIYNPYQLNDDFIKPKFEYFKPMQSLFTQYDYSDFKPIPWKNGSGYTLANTAETYFIYVRKENYQMSRGDWFLKKKDGPKRNYAWLNLVTGEQTEFKEIVPEQNFISPWSGQADSILISEIIKESHNE